MDLSTCMKLVARMSEADQDELLSLVDEYTEAGIAPQDAQRMAARDMLAEAERDRAELLALARAKIATPAADETAQPATDPSELAQDATPDAPQVAPEIYRALRDALVGAKTNAGTPDYWRSRIYAAVNAGALTKQDVDASGIDAWIRESPGKVSKIAVLGWLDERAPDDDETQYSQTARAYGGRDAYERDKSAGRTRLTYPQWVTVRTPAFKEWFGDWEIAASTPKRRAETFAEARQQASAFQGLDLVNNATGMIARVSRNALDKMLSAKAVGKSETPQTHSLAVANLDALFERAILGWSKPDSAGDPSIAAIHRLFAPLLVGGKARIVKMTVKETARADQPNPLYTVEAVELEEKSPAAQWVDSTVRPDGIDPTSIRSTGDVRTLAQRIKDFNPDTVSKAVDPVTGEPLVMYHGTSRDNDGDAFTVWDVYGSNYGLMGSGSYFTADPAVASSYTKKGRGPAPSVYPVFLALRRPIDMDARADAQAWRERVPDAAVFHGGGDTNESWYRAAEDAMSEAMVPHHEGAEAMQDALRAMGYDGITHVGGGRARDGGMRHRVFIAFEPEQIKSAIGNSGAFDAESADVRFSRADDTEEENARRALRENDEMFALPRSDKTTPEAIAADVDPEITVIERKIPGEKRWDLVMPDGKVARLIVRKPNPYGPTLYGFDMNEGEMVNVFEGRPGENPEDVQDDIEDVYIDASQLESGGRGSAIYQIAATLAHNTGRIFIGDPAGLSDEAMRRRNEHMLSSALKFGTTRHLAPHPRQTVGAPSLGVPPLRWVYGDDLGNIRRMMEVSVAALDNAMPSARTLDFDANAGRFSDRSRGGRHVPRRAVDAAGRRAAQAGKTARAVAGSRTLARGAVLRALLREESREGEAGGRRDGVLARLARLGSDASQEVKGIFYARRDDLSARPGRSGTSTQAPPSERARLLTKTLNNALVKYGLGAHWSNAYEAAPMPDALSGIGQAFQVAFGRDIQPVTPTARRFGIFDGVHISQAPGVVFVNTQGQTGFVQIAGHELWHDLKRTRPDLADWFRTVAMPYWRNLDAHRDKINALLQPGETPYSENRALEELEADFLGDSLADPDFLQALADDSPSKFRDLLNTIVQWLGRVAIKLRKGRGSSAYVSDVEALQDHLRAVLVAYAEGKPLPAGPDLSASPDEAQAPAFARAARAPTNGGPSSPRYPNGTTGNPQAASPQALDLPAAGLADQVIYELQDRHVDLKRVTAAVTKAAGELGDRVDAYLREELYHGRVATRARDFLEKEVRPLFVEMRAAGVTLDEFERFLHARHAQERNAAMQAINDERNDNEALSGMTDDEAARILADAKPVMHRLAERVDAMTEGTRHLMEVSGLETTETVDALRGAYQHYVPLHRDELHDDARALLGSGFNMRGSNLKRATGSTARVTNIIAHIVEQREATIVRAEKNLVAMAVYAMALKAPDSSFWQADTPPEVSRIGPDGQVHRSIDPVYKMRENVLTVKVNGEDRIVVFNERNKRAQRMARALKNLDVKALDGVVGVIAIGTRWLASVNTQYNPVFAIVNGIRDLQGAVVNLSSTPIRGKRIKIMSDAMRHGYAAVWRAERQARDTKPGQQRAAGQRDEWVELYHELASRGGLTGWRDSYETIEDRAKALQREAMREDRSVARKGGEAVLGVVSDLNTAVETGIRLAVYKAGLDSGLSKDRAASVAKNITVNFNRKGRLGQQLGALFAFFNASIQGSARLAQALAGPGGRNIIAGGILVGVLQAAMLAAMDDDDEENIPDWERERNFIIPLGQGKTIKIPMGLGLHVLPNVGRHLAEMAFAAKDGKRIDATKHFGQMLATLLEAFNPLGSAGGLLQMITPTVADPIVQLATNKDFTGKPIYRERAPWTEFKSGASMGRDSTSPVYGWLAEGLNRATGGDDKVRNTNLPPGFSPQPEAIRFIVETIGGGVWRESERLIEAMIAARKPGVEVEPHRMPLIGRFYGDLTGPMAPSAKFYENARHVQELQQRIDNLEKSGDPDADKKIDLILDQYPEVKLARQASKLRKEISRLRDARREMVISGQSEADMREVDQEIAVNMRDFNNDVREAMAKMQ